MRQFRKQELRIARCGRDGRGSLVGASILIWAGGEFKPASVRLMRGKAELRLGVDIIKQMDLTVYFWGRQFKVGQIEWGTMTFGEKNHLGDSFSSDL